MEFNKIFNLMEHLEVRVISECSQELTIDTYLTKQFESPEYNYEYEEALSTLRVEIRIPAAQVEYTFVTDAEADLLDRLFKFIPEGFDPKDLQMYLENFSTQEENQNG